MPLKILQTFGKKQEDKKPTNIQQKIALINTAISAKSYADLEGFLTSECIYEEPKEHYEPYIDWSDYPDISSPTNSIFYRPAWGYGMEPMSMYPDPTYALQPPTKYRRADLYQYSSRPLLEAIYLDYPDEFYKLISSFVDSHNLELQDAFMRAWDKMSRQNGSDLPSQLFIWNDEAMDKAKEQLKAMNLYGRKLAQAGVSKGDTIKSLSAEIQNDIETFTLHRTIQNKTTQTEFEVAKFKLGIVKELHRDDTELNKKRPNSSWKNAVMNVVSFLLTGNLAQLIHYAYTGDYWFFGRTDSRKHVETVQQAFDPSLKMGLVKSG